MGGVASMISPSGAKTTTVQVTVHPTNPPFRVQGVYPKIFRGDQGLPEAQWFSLINAIQTGLARGTEQMHGQMWRSLVCMSISLTAVMVGLMVGFLCSFLGGVSHNYAVLGVGIAFVVVFIVGIVMLITSAVSLQKSQAQVMQMGMANLDPLQRTLAESHPTVRMEAFNIKPPLMFQLKITIVQSSPQPQYPYPYGQQQPAQMNMPYPGMPGSPPGVSPTAMQGPYQPQPYYPGPPPPYYGEQPGYPQPNYAPPAYSYPQGPPVYMGGEALPVAQPVLNMYNQPSAPSHDEQHAKEGGKR